MALAPGWHKLRGDGKESGLRADMRDAIIDRNSAGQPKRYKYWARVDPQGLIIQLGATGRQSARNEPESRDFIARAEAVWGCSIASLIEPLVDDWIDELIVRL